MLIVAVWLLTVFAWISLVCYMYLRYQKSNLQYVDGRSKQVALLLIAHPDDECMFFGPSIHKLLEIGFDVQCLCLTNGNFYGQGKLRTEELIKSLKVFNIKSENVKCLDIDVFPDDPNALWPIHQLSENIRKHMKTIANLHLILTFDSFGVSGHPNHCALRNAVSVVQKCHRDLLFYELKTCSVFRKYIGLLNLPISVALYICGKTSLVALSSPMQVWCNFLAMMKHKSQLMWFRYLYILFSKYMVINELIIIKDSAVT
ncbi:N-acetylglucosaminyl-phosphatidylinositol de-N-acetylase-like [Convolutriloba macropyga]|uniref:N-acetylglucosaminyl-phosphatidylinositol de-N-acetylase-like n=1 Tax=Convolutriloba macropyga TaxID=536237 RepID=UPI003F520D1E